MFETCRAPFVLAKEAEQPDAPAHPQPEATKNFPPRRIAQRAICVPLTASPPASEEYANWC